MVTIQPLKQQYLTALKERQQIINKLNEIITGLNSLDFDDLATIQTELTSIRQSLQNQNNLITDINDSITQIESELESFDNRLISANASITDVETHLTNFEEDTEYNLNGKVDKSGDTMTGNLSIPLTGTGMRDSYAVNGERLQNDLDNYSPMIRNTGNQEKRGILTLYDSTPLCSENIERDKIYTSQIIGKAYRGTDKNGKNLFSVRATKPANTRDGRLQISCYTENEDGVEKNGYLDLLISDSGKITLRIYSPYTQSFHELYKDV